MRTEPSVEAHVETLLPLLPACLAFVLGTYFLLLQGTDSITIELLFVFILVLSLVLLSAYVFHRLAMLLQDSPPESTPATSVCEQPPDYASIDVTLEEVRRRYDKESQRRAGTESKLNSLLTVNGFVISIVGFVPVATQSIDIDAAGRLLIVLPSIVVIFIAFFVLKSRFYFRPGKDIDDFFEYAKQSQDRTKCELLLSYIVATEDYAVKNREFSVLYRMAFWFTLIAVVLLIFVPNLTRLLLA